VLQAHLRFGLSISGVGVAAVVYFFAAATWSLADTSPSSQRLPGRWRILVLLRSGYLVADGYGRLLVCSGYLVAGGHCRLLLRSGYLVALWMDAVLSTAATWSLADGCCAFYRWMLCHHGFTHPLLATIARMYFSWQA